MDLTNSAIKLLVFLMPGFLVMKTIALKCDMKEEDYQYFVVEALIYSVFVYALAGAVFIDLDLTKPKSIGLTILLSVLVGIIVGEVKNRELLSRIFRASHGRLSTHDKIFYRKGMEKIAGKWHVIGLKNGKEICGVIREYNTENNEMLVEQARWVRGGRLAEDAMWLYLPPNEGIEYIRSIEEGGHGG